MSFTTAGADNPFESGNNITTFVLNPDFVIPTGAFPGNYYYKTIWPVRTYYNAIFGQNIEINSSTDEIVASGDRPISGVLFPRGQ